ncbi:MAG TPA: DUF4129 domain-containing protein [Holophagaceae bacterium]|nr:DUF4129 domain-containing protein [Holophagaceae bacterium]
MLERLQLRLRPRRAWEAVDSGFALLRAHGRSIYAAWLAGLLPVSAALFACFWDRAWIAMLLVWWLKPLFDRLALHALAKATFGERATLRSLPGALGSVYRRGAVAGLLWRRFSPNRAFTLPVWQLEGQGGAGYRRRAPVLLRRVHGPSLLFTAVCFVLTLTLAIALGLGILYLVPDGLLDTAAPRLFNGGDQPGPLFYLMPILATAILEPFYVAGGFGLYLNRRVQLEAWDLDLAFRQLGRRLLTGAGRGAAVLALAAGLLAGGVLRAAVPGGVAEAPAPQAQAPKPLVPKAELKEVLKAPEFQTWSEERTWHWKFSGPKVNAQPRFQMPEGLLRALGLILKGFIILLVLAGVGWFLWRFVGARRFGLDRDQDGAPAPDQLFGLDIRPGALPKDVAAAALALWRAGDARGSLSLLYRGALARLVHERGLDLPPGATEGDCLRRSGEVLAPPAGAYFRVLTLSWQALAYAHRDPSDGEGLCRDWTVHFGGGRG